MKIIMLPTYKYIYLVLPPVSRGVMVGLMWVLSRGFVRISRIEMCLDGLRWVNILKEKDTYYEYNN